MRSILKYIALLIFTFSSLRLFASPQIPDYIIVKNDTIPTYNLILESYLQKHDTTETGRLFGLSFRGWSSMNCWRGYQAIYKIENGSLFLVAIINCGEFESKTIDISMSLEKMKTIFRDRVINERVYINWFSGELNYPLNNKILRRDGVFYKIYEHEAVLNVKRGKVTGAKNVNNYVDNPEAIDRMDKDKIQDVLSKELKTIKWTYNMDSDDWWCSKRYLVTINKHGQVSKVSVIDYDTGEAVKFWERKNYNHCTNKIFNALKGLKFDIIKDKGKPISENIYFELVSKNESLEKGSWF